MATTTPLDRYETPAAQDRRWLKERLQIRRLIEIHPEFGRPGKAAGPAAAEVTWLAQILPFPARR